MELMIKGKLERVTCTVTTDLDARTTIDMGSVRVPVWERNKAEAGSKAGPYSVYDVLTEFYDQNIAGLIRDYLSRESAELLKRPEFSGASRLRLISCKEKYTRSMLHQRLNCTVVDLIMKCSVAAEIMPAAGDASENAAGRDCRPGSAGERRSTLMLRFRYVLDLLPREQCVFGPLICPYEEGVNDIWEQRYGIRTNEYLLPVLRAQDYEDVAYDLLLKYYPEEMLEIHRRDPLGIDPEDLAHRMRLKIEEVRFADPALRGQLYFDNVDATVLDEQGQPLKVKIAPDTMLLSAALRDKPEIRKTTIMHECTHKYLNEAYYLLQKMTGRSAVAVMNSRVEAGSHPVSLNSPTDWMEQQCDRLPAMLLMERVSTIRFIENRLKETGGRRGIKEMRDLITALAAHSQVSFSMAKVRLIELGYPEAEGIRTYVNGFRVEDYGCAGPWEPGVTYTIPLRDASKLMKKQPEFKAVLRTGRYIYADGHYALKHPAFVGMTKGGKLVLTPYARTHIEQCCLAFRVAGWYRSAGYEYGVANSKKEAAGPTPCTNYQWVAEPGTPEYIIENKNFIQDAEHWRRLLLSLDPKFPIAVMQVMDDRGITQEAIALEAKVDRRAIFKYLNQDNPSIEHVVGICVALKIPPDLSKALLERAGHVLRDLPSHHIYWGFLQQPGVMTIARCEEILEEEHMKPLFQGEDKVKKPSRESA